MIFKFRHAANNVPHGSTASLTRSFGGKKDVEEVNVLWSSEVRQAGKFCFVPKIEIKLVARQ